jgi:hypothetical protein
VEVPRDVKLGFKDNWSLSYSGVGIISKSISGCLRGLVELAMGKEEDVSKVLAAVSGGVGIDGVGVLSREGCSAGVLEPSQVGEMVFG